LTTNLRLLLDESVTDVLADLICKSSSAINVEYVRDLTIKGQEDEVIVRYADREKRIVVTTETSMNEYTFPICTHAGIIVLAGKCRHESIQAGIFQKFLLSGKRQQAKHSVTTLCQDEARIKTHSEELRFRL
jgi:predicted nuclease of predicted toxin-antitoxin system